MRESKIEAYLVKRVKARGGEVRKVSWPGRRGAPDRLVMMPLQTVWHPQFADEVIPARTIWVELKATGVAAEDYQLREHERMRAMGQHVEVIDSLGRVDWLLA